MANKSKIALCIVSSLTTAMIITPLLAALPRYVLADPSAWIVCYFWHQIQTDEDRDLQTCSATTPANGPGE